MVTLAATQIPIILDIVIILGFSLLVILIFHRLKIPYIIGFLLTGILIGPNLLNIVGFVDEVNIMAEIGIILLMFSIGIELSLRELAKIRKFLLLGGTIQVFVTIAIVAFIAFFSGFSIGKSIFLGFLISLSSTAIVLKMLKDNNEINTQHGKAMIAILIFQDIIIVPMMLITPMLAGDTENILSELLWLFLKGLLVIGVSILLSRIVIPKFFELIVKTSNMTLFLLSVIVICFAVAFGTSLLGLSLSLGAFLAGLIISDSRYSHFAVSNITPFRDIFASFFFISVGMLLDGNFFVQHIIPILIISFVVLTIKGIIVLIAGVSLRLHSRSVILMGISLNQIGEFAFVILLVGMKYALIDATTYQYFLSVSIFSMIITPILYRFSHGFTQSLLNKSVTKKIISRFSNEKSHKHISEDKPIEDHLVIIGYGINGHNLAFAAKSSGIPYVVVEADRVQFKQAISEGHDVVYGDACQINNMEHVNIQKARVVVIAISDTTATVRITAMVKDINSSAWIIVRTRRINEMDYLYQLGANEVIPEEFETSVEIFTRVLEKYMVPQNEIMQFQQRIRDRGYQLFRETIDSEEINEHSILHRSDYKICSIDVPERSRIIGEKLSDINLRAKGINLLAVERNNEMIENIDGNFVFKQKDRLFYFGKEKHTTGFFQFLQNN